jgi:hypothetical protein
VNFIRHKPYRNHFTVLKRTRELHLIGPELNFISFVMQQNYNNFFSPRNIKGSFVFFFNHHVDRVVHKLIGAEGQGIRWTNSKRLNEGGIMQ